MDFFYFLWYNVKNDFTHSEVHLFTFLWSTLWGQILMTFLVSMVPFIELRGALPLASGAGLDLLVAFPVAILGNLVPVPFIILFIRHIFNWMKKHMPKLNSLVERLEEKGKSKRDTINKSLFWGLFIFVAIPLPGTGAWTGALIAAMLDIRLKRAFPAIAFGVVTAGTIMAILSYLVPGLFF
jgi:uncharacterized membrane protein